MDSKIYYHKNSEKIAVKIKEKPRELGNIMSRGLIEIYEYDEYGNQVSYKTSSNYQLSNWHYDKNGNELMYADSNGFSSESTYDDNGNELTYKSSNGHYRINLKYVTKEEFENHLKK